MYHSHHNATDQVGRGLLGAFIVDPKDPDERYDSKYGVTQEVVFIHNDALGGFTINGHGFPATAPIVAKLGDKVLIRFMNEGHRRCTRGTPTGSASTSSPATGWPLGSAAFYADTLGVNPGERYDAIVDCDRPGVWAFHCHILPHVEGRTACSAWSPPSWSCRRDAAATGRRDDDDGPRDAARTTLPRTGKLLLATDLSPASAAATDAGDRARRTGSARRCSSSASSTPDSSGCPAAASASGWTRSGREREQVAQDLVERGRRVGVAVTFLVWEGDPGEAIVEAAEAEHADLIVVGTHGRSGVSRFLIGSVSDYVVRHAHCPVMVVRGARSTARAGSAAGRAGRPDGGPLPYFV